MSDSWLRRLLIPVIVLLILHAVGTWAYSALGVAAAIASAVLVAAVSFFSARMAGQGHNARFVVPTLMWTRTVEFAPFLIGFAAPVLVLLTAYLELGRRTSRSAHLRPDAPAALHGA